jgi:hypothetical protein
MIPPTAMKKVKDSPKINVPNKTATMFRGFV